MTITETVITEGMTALTGTVFIVVIIETPRANIDQQTTATNIKEVIPANTAPQTTMKNMIGAKDTNIGLQAGGGNVLLFKLSCDTYLYVFNGFSSC